MASRDENDFRYTPAPRSWPTPAQHAQNRARTNPQPAGTGLGQQGNSFEMRLGAWNRARASADSVFGDTPNDPYNGANPWDLLAGMMNGNRNGSGGGGGGGGGSSAASKAAYQQMLAQLTNQQATNNKLFDDRTASLQSTQAAGNTRLDGILAELTAAAARTRGDVSASYASGQNQLGALGAQFAQEEAQRAQGAGSTLGMFGAPSGMVERGYGAMDTVNAQRAMLAGQAGSADAMYANRGNVYNGLMGDARTGNSQLFDQLMAQVAAQRQQQAAADAAQQAQLGIQAAQAGVKL